MKHNITELFVLKSVESGKTVYCTQEYLNLRGLEVTPRELRKTAKLLVYRKITGCNCDRTKIYDKDGVRVVFPYGVDYWFDEREERDAYREEAQAERQKFLQWNKVKKAIIAKLDEKSKEELEAILANI